MREVYAVYDTTTHENLAEALEFLGSVEAERIAHDTEAGIVDGKGYTVSVEDFSSGGSKTNHPEPV